MAKKKVDFDHSSRNRNRNRSKWWPTMENILDKQFPKGECKERGRALVMLAYIELMLTGTKFDRNGEPKSHD
jgi:hypothetical protein